MIVSGPTHMYLGMGSSTYNSQPYSQISFQSEATELPCREKSMGWDKVTLRDTKAIICVASESRARAKLGGNFKKADFNSSKPKGRKRKHICAPSYCCAVAQLCLTLWDPMGCSPPGSSVHGILWASTLEWAAMPSSKGSSRHRDQTHVSKISCISRLVLYY